MKFTLDETQNNRLLAAIFQELAVIVFDPQKEVVFANANMTDILGYSQEEIIGLPHRTFCFDHYAVVRITKLSGINCFTQSNGFKTKSFGKTNKEKN